MVVADQKTKMNKNENVEEEERDDSFYWEKIHGRYGKKAFTLAYEVIETQRAIRFVPAIEATLK